MKNRLILYRQMVLKNIILLVILLMVKQDLYAYNTLEDLYDVKFYRLEFNVINTGSLFSARVTMKATTLASPLSSFVAELRKSYVSVDSVVINGVKRTFTHSATNEVSASVSPSLPAGTEFTSVIYYHNVTGYNSSYFKSLIIANTPADTALETMAEPYYSSEWFACKQSLTDKADSVDVFVTCPSYLTVASNGVLTDTVPVPGGKKRWEWKCRHRIDYYLVAFSVCSFVQYNFYAKPANYADGSGGQDSILVQNFMGAGYLTPANITSLLKLKGLIEKFSERIMLYPFADEKYGVYQWYGAVARAMEHQTITGTRNFGFSLMAHELFHHWYGDFVTCATWSDVWINEGFAQYSQYIAKQLLPGNGDPQAEITGFHTSALTAPTGSVYVPPSLTNNWGRIFSTPLTYNKGASLIHMMRYLFSVELMDNDTTFYKLLHDFLADHADGNATGADFRDKAEALSGLEFHPFFDQWFFGEGFPTYNLQWQQTGVQLFITINQVTSAPAVTPFFDIPVQLKITRTGGDTIVLIAPAANLETFEFHSLLPVTGIVVDPADWLLDKAGTISKYRQWTGNSGTDWNLAGNWSPEAIPAETDGIIIPVTANSPVITTAEKCATILIRPDALLTIQPGGSLTAGNHVYLQN